MIGALCLLLSATVYAQDAFPIAQIVNSPDVRSWPITAAITSVSFDGAVTRVEFTKHHGFTRWPDYTPPGWTGPIQYTLWLCLQTPQWTCAGFIQFWEGRDGSGSPSDPDVPSLYAVHWYYAARWAPLYGHGPIQPGEPIGFLVTAGNARDTTSATSVSERSNVVLIHATDRGTFTFAPSLEPAPPVPAPPPVVVNPPPVVVTPPPAPPVALPPVPATTDPLLVQIAELVRQIAATQQQTLAVEQDTNKQVTQVNKTVGQTLGDVMAFVGKYIAPAVGAWIAATKVAKP